MSKKIEVKVIRTFKNKYSKTLHKAGSCLSISKKRLDEINNAGYSDLVKEIEPKEGE